MTTKLVLLGTGSPGCDPHAYQTSAAIVVNEMPFVIDCGGGAVQRLSTAQSQGTTALSLGNLNHLILTHLHPDHTAGLADFIISTWIRGRRQPLKIYGPQGTQKMVKLLVEAYEIGIASHWEHVSPTSWPLLYEVIEYSDGVLYADEAVTITAFRVSHGVMETYGLKFVAQDKTIVWSSDTRPTPSLLEHAAGCDWLVHEAYSATAMNSNPALPKVYFERMHTSTVELAEIAREVRPKKLILQHEMHFGTSADAMVQEITDLYDGEVIYGRDLDVFE